MTLKIFIMIRCDVLHMQLWRHNEGTSDVIKKSHSFPMRSTCDVPSFNFFLGVVSEIEVQSFSVFPTWLPHQVTYDIKIVCKSSCKISCSYGENFVSIWQVVVEKNMKVLCERTNKQPNKQTSRQATMARSYHPFIQRRRELKIF